MQVVLALSTARQILVLEMMSSTYKINETSEKKLSRKIPTTTEKRGFVLVLKLERVLSGYA